MSDDKKTKINGIFKNGSKEEIKIIEQIEIINKISISVEIETKL